MGLKIKIKARKIKVGDPTKLITKPLEGVTNAAGSHLQNVVQNVGQVVQTPGFAEMAQGAGAAFGVPVPPIGASAFTTRKADFPQQTAPMPQTQNFAPPADNSKLYIIIAAAIGGLAILLVVLKRK